MSLPLPPPLPPALPLPPVHEKIEVNKVGFDKLEVRVGSITEIITRNEAFRLLGKLERTVGEL